MSTLINLIDGWLVKINDAIWTIRLGEEILGTIEIVNGEHKISILKNVPITKLNLSKEIRCTHKYIK